MNAADEQLLGQIYLASIFAGCIGMGLWEVVRIKLIQWAQP